MHECCRIREGWGMSGDDNKHAVAEFVERCQNQHDLAFADEALHPKCVNHYRPEGPALAVAACPEQMRPERARGRSTLANSRPVVPATARACPTHGAPSQSSAAE